MELLLAETEAYETGRRVGEFIGAAFWLVVLLALALRCLVVTRRPDVNTLCGASCIVMLGSLMALALAGLIANQATEMEAINGLLYIAAGLGLFVAPGLGIAGLIGRWRADPPQRGEWMGGWGVSIPTILLGAASLIALLHDKSDAQNSGRTAEVSRVNRGTGAGSERRAFDELNFSYQSPAAGYHELTPSVVNEAASIVYRAPRSQTLFLIIAERLGVDLGVGSAGLEEISKSNIYAVSTNHESSDSHDVVVSGVEGRQFAVEATIDGHRLTYRFWCGVHNGFAYQMIAYRPVTRDEGRSFDREFSKLLSGFTLLDPSEVCHSAGYRVAGSVDSDVFAYRFTPPSEGGWAAWEDVADDYSGADYGALFDNQETAFLITPLPLIAPEVTLDDFAGVVLPTIALEPPDRRLKEIGRQEVPVDGLRWVDYDATVEFDEVPYRYRVRVAASDQAGYLLAAWSSVTTEAQMERLEKSFEGFSLKPGPLDLSGISDPVRRDQVAEGLNALGMIAYEAGQYPVAASRFEAAVKMAPSTVRYLRNLLNTVETDLGPAAALDRIQPHVDAADSPPESLALRGALLSRLGRYDEAVDALAAASKDQTLDNELLFDFASAAAEAERFDDALAVFEAARSRGGSGDVLRWHSQLLSAAGRHEEAIATAQELLAAAPQSVDFTTVLAEAYESADRYAEALDVVDRAIAKGRGVGELQTLRGRLLINSDQYPQAKLALEQALKIRPTDAEANELMSYVTTLLGRGDNRRIRQPIEPVGVPAAVDEWIATAPQETATAPAGGLLELARVRGYAFRAGEPRRETLRRTVRVLDRRGVDAMTTLHITFDPTAERVYLNELVVRDADGEEIGRGEVSDYYVLDDQSSGYDSYDQVLVAPVPALRPGCEVQYTVTHETLGRRLTFGFESNFLSGFDPIARSVVFVTGETDGLASRASRGVSKQVTADALYWTITDPELVRIEPAQQAPARYLPMVWIADKSPSWTQLGDEYLSDLEGALREDPHAQTLADRLVEGAETIADRVDRIANYVREEYTYYAQEFGVRGVVPHTVKQIHRSRSGDCKDHAVLLHHLLRCAGITSRLALVDTSDTLLVGMPSLDQFDHMVVYVPDLPRRAGGVEAHGVIDATLKGCDPLHGVAESAAGKSLLVLEPGGSRLVTTSDIDAEECSVRCDRRVRFASADDLTDVVVEESLRLSPRSAGHLRTALRAASDDERREFLHALVSANRAATIRSVGFENLDDVSLPFTIRCEYHLAGAAKAVGADSIRLEPPTHWTRSYCEASAVETRTTPFEYQFPLDFRCSTTLVPPRGYRPAGPRASDARNGRPVANWRADSKVDSKGWRAGVRYVRTPGVYAADAYRDFYADAQALVEWAAAPIELTREGS